MSLVFEKELPGGLFCVYSKAPSFSYFEVNQVHGTKVVLPSEEVLEADGLYLPKGMSGQLAIKTADCLPIAVSGHKGSALLHAGWKGLRDHIILQKEVQDLDPYDFFIGPSIQQISYEVGAEFLDYFPQDQAAFNEDKGRLTFSLQMTALRQIQKHYPQAQAFASDIDTFQDSKLHSFRQNQTTQRNWNIFKIHGPAS